MMWSSSFPACIYRFMFFPLFFWDLIISEVEGVGQDLIQLSFEILRGQKCFSLLRNLLWSLTLTRKNFFLMCHQNFPGCNLCPLSFTEYPWEESVSIFFITSLLGVEDLQLGFPFWLLQRDYFGLFLRAVHSNPPTVITEPCWAPFVYFSCPGDVDVEEGNQVWYCRCNHASESREK